MRQGGGDLMQGRASRFPRAEQQLAVGTRRRQCFSLAWGCACFFFLAPFLLPVFFLSGEEAFGLRENYSITIVALSQ